MDPAGRSRRMRWEGRLGALRRCITCSFSLPKERAAAGTSPAAL